MNSIDFEKFKDFISKLKYEYMSLDDYKKVFILLGGDDIIKYETNQKWVLYTMCHNINPFDGSPKLEFYLESKSLYCYTQCNCSMDIIELVRKRFEILGKPKQIFSQLNGYVNN
jgi:hypothetical protein